MQFLLKTIYVLTPITMFLGILQVMAGAIVKDANFEFWGFIIAAVSYILIKMSERALKDRGLGHLL